MFENHQRCHWNIVTEGRVSSCREMRPASERAGVCLVRPYLTCRLVLVLFCSVGGRGCSGGADSVVKLTGAVTVPCSAARLHCRLSTHKHTHTG